MSLTQSTPVRTIAANEIRPVAVNGNKTPALPGKELRTAIVRAFAVRGAAMQELFDGERADLVRELQIVRARLANDDGRARLIDVALETNALPAMRGAMQVWEGARA